MSSHSLSVTHRKVSISLAWRYLAAPASLTRMALLKRSSKLIKGLVSILVPIAIVLTISPPRGRTHSATFVVNSTTDAVDATPDGACLTAAGDCTLRAAIMEANAFPDADAINFDPNVFDAPKTIKLSIPGVNEDFSATGDLDIGSDVTITGLGANLTTIDADGIDRVFDIRNAATVFISGLTVTGGQVLSIAPGILGSGGGIRTQGALLTLTSVTVSGNTAGSQGGGIEKTGPLVLNSCTVSNNTAGFEPGTPGGGGIMDYIGGRLTLNNSTVSGNTSPHGGGIGSSNYPSDILMTNSTVANNTGGGLQVRNGTVTMKNTIMANPGFNCFFTGYGPAELISQGYNLSTDNSCANPIVGVSGGLNGSGDLNNLAANLAPLALNPPGSTATQALCTGASVPHPSCGAVSPAIDKGGDCLAVDQRGVSRPQGAACDIGAYEAGTTCTPLPPNMVAWWPADNHPNDIRNGNHGTPVGGVSYASGKVDQAFNFPSLSSTGSDRVALTSAPSANTFTIEGWVFANQHGPSGYRTIYADNARGFWLKSGKLNWWSPGGDRFVGNTIVPLGAWHHVAITYSQGTFTGYLDGAADGTSFVTGEFLPTGTGLGIGGHSNALHEDFDGLIDELAIYDRDLSPSEILAIFNAGSPGKCKCVPAPSGLASWWPGDGNANDIISGNHGVLEPGVGFLPGEVNGAFLFNGVDGGGVNLGNVPAFDFTQSSSFTIDAWINSFAVTLPPDDGQFVVALNYDRSNTAQVLAIQSSTEKVFFQVRDANGLTAGPLLSPTALSKNAWHHVAGVRDVTNSGTTLKLYVDGVLVATAIDPSTGPLSLNAPDLIGRRNSNPTTSTFNGLIDEVEIFNRALTQQEIQAIFNAGSAGKCKCASPASGLVSWWPGDGNATDIQDGNNGTLVNGATFGAGKVGQAFSFDGVNDGISILKMGNLNMGPSDFSIEAWVNVAQTQTPLGMIFLNYGGVPTYSLSISSDAKAQVHFRPGVPSLSGSGNEPFVSATGTTSLNDGQWHHLVGVRRGATALIYVDGVLEESVTNPAVLSVNGGSVDTGGCLYARIGSVHSNIGHCNSVAPNPQDPNFFQGLIDEVKIYNRALTACEIQAVVTGTIIIKKNTVGGNETFGYTTGGAGLTPFSITTSGGTGSQTFNNIVPGPKSITESSSPSGWGFTNLECSDPDGGTTVSGKTANIDLDAGEIVVCAYTNTKCPPITFNPTGSLTAAVVNTPYTQTIMATGGCSSSFSYSVSSGALPAGFTLGANGVLSGTATQPGDFTFTVTATDSCGCSRSQIYTLKVECPTVALRLFNTGVTDDGSVLADGTADAHYGLTLPNGLPSTAQASAPQSASWLPNSTSSKWIVPLPGPAAPSLGQYIYRTTFDLTGCDPASVVISGRWAANNSGFIRVNGGTAQLFPTPLSGFAAFTPFTLNSGNSSWGVGINTLEFVVNRQSNVAGLRVEMSGTVKCCPACATPPPGMVAWWPLDEPNGATVVNDVAGINNQGTPKPGSPLGNANAPTAVPGRVSGAVNFDSNSLTTGPNVEVPNHTEINFGTGSLSIDAWVFIKPPQPLPFAATALHPIVDKLQPTNSAFTQGRGYAFHLVSSFSAGARLQFVMGAGGNLANYLGPNAPSVPYNTWTHVAVTVNRGSGTVAFYVNGIPVPPSPPVPSMPAATITNTQRLLIGESRLPGRRQAFITIDELEMFRRALSTTEIRRIFNAGGGGKCKCLVASNEAVTCGPNGTFIYTFTLKNLSNFTATGVNFSPSSGITITPSSMTIPPLAPGASTNVTVTISGSAAISGANVCFFAGLTGSFSSSPDTNNLPAGRNASPLSGNEEPRMVFPVPVNPGCRIEFCITLPICHQTTSLTVNKIITTAAPPPIVTPPSTATFPVTVLCQPSGYTQSLNLSAAVPSQNFTNIPLGNTCTVTEGPLPPPFGNPLCAALGWSPPIYSPAQTITLSSTSPNIVSITNRFGCFTNCVTCATPPPGMVAWWPMNVQTSQVHDIAPLPGSTFDNVGAAGVYQPVNGYVGGAGFGALYFNNTPASVVVVPPQAELDFVNGDFSIDAWVSVVPGSPTEIQPIIDKLASPSGPGFAFYVRNQRLELNINGTTFASTGPPMLTATNPLANSGPWNHVAVTIRRNPAQIIFYLNGGQVGTFTPALISSVVNPVPLWIGETRVLGGRRELAIDELEIFNRVLPQADLQQIFNAGAGGKCRPALP